LLRIPNFFSSNNDSKINIAVNLRKLIYLYQKACFTSIIERKFPLEQIPFMLQYIKTYYISNNDLFLNNPAICTLEQLKEIKKLEEMQNNSVFLLLMDNETLLIIQSLKISNAIITILSYHAMVPLLYFINKIVYYRILCLNNWKKMTVLWRRIHWIMKKDKRFSLRNISRKISIWQSLNFY